MRDWPGRAIIRKTACIAVLALVGALTALPAFGDEHGPRSLPATFVNHTSQSVQFHYYLAHPDQAPDALQRAMAASGYRGRGASTASPSVGPTGDRFNRDDTGLPQNEESITVCRNRSNVVLGNTNDYRGLVDEEGNFTGWDLSTNGGKTVANEGLLPSVNFGTEQVPSGGDPLSASDGSCNLYAASLAYNASDPFGPHPNGVVAYKSTVGTLTSGGCGDATDSMGNPSLSDPDCWPTKVAVAQTLGGATGHFLDKPWMSVGDTGDGIHAWFTYSDFTNDPTNPLGFSQAQVYAVRCDANLANCTSPILISSNDNDVAFSYVTIGPDHRTYVTWAGVQGELTGDPQTFTPKLRIAPAGSTTFGSEQTVTTLNNAMGFDNFLQADDFRIATGPKNDVAMVNGHPRVFVVYDACSQRPLGTICENPKVQLAYSDNDGQTWKIKRVSVSGDNYFPTLSVDPTRGKLAVAWYTSRFDAFLHRQDIELVTVNPATLKILKRQRVTSPSNEPDADPALGGAFIGDYIQATALNGKAYVHYNANYTRMKFLGMGIPVDQQDNYLTVRPLT